jgi:hypothetical protein
MGPVLRVYNNNFPLLIAVPMFSEVDVYVHGPSLMIESKIVCNSSCGKVGNFVIEDAEVRVGGLSSLVDIGMLECCATEEQGQGDLNAMLFASRTLKVSHFG